MVFDQRTSAAFNVENMFLLFDKTSNFNEDIRLTLQKVSPTCHLVDRHLVIRMCRCCSHGYGQHNSWLSSNSLFIMCRPNACRWNGFRPKNMYVKSNQAMHENILEHWLHLGLWFYVCSRNRIWLFTPRKISRLIQGILKGGASLYHWPPVRLVWNQLYDNWQFLFLFARQTNPNQSNRRSMVQWYSPFSIPWLIHRHELPCTYPDITDIK